MNDNISRVYDVLHAIYSKHRRKHRENPDSKQMCCMWSTNHPPDTIERTGPICDIEAALDIQISDDEALELYDMDLDRASRMIFEKRKKKCLPPKDGIDRVGNQGVKFSTGKLRKNPDHPMATQRTHPMTPIPKDPQAWIAEIRDAQLDAAEAIPFGPIVGADIAVQDLFHLAPATALKFRGLPFTRRNLKRATDAALSSHVATISQSPELASFPTVCFAFAYLASHYGLGLVSEEQVNSVMNEITENPEQLLAPTSKPRSRKPALPRRSPSSARRLKSPPKGLE